MANEAQQDANFQGEYSALLHFLGYMDQSGYLFAMADDQRFIPQINNSLVQDLGAKGISVGIMFLQLGTDEPMFYQVRKGAEGHGALIIANVYSIATAGRAGEDALVALNFSREAFWELGIPLLFWCDKPSMALVARFAPDLLSQRRMSTVHFTGTVDGHVAEQVKGRDREAYLSSERFEALNTKVQLLEKRLEGAIAASYPLARIVREIALPLAKCYAELGMKDEAKKVLRDYDGFLSEVKDVNVLMDVAGVYELMYDYEGAIRVLEGARVLLDLAIEEVGGTDFWLMQQMGIVQQNLGDAHEQIGEVQAAMAHFRVFNKMFEVLVTANPENLELKNNLAISYERLGGIYEQTGDWQNALKHYEEYHRLGQEIYSSSPGNLGYKNGLAISYERLGGIYEQTGDWQNALKHYEEYHRLRQEIYSSSPGNLRYKNGLAISYSKLGGIYEQTGDWQNALLNYQECNRLGQEIYSTSPGALRYKHGLAISFEKLGGIYEQTGDLQNAWLNYEQDMRLMEEIYSSSPGNLGYKNGLAISFFKLGSLAQKQNDLSKAKSYYLQTRQHLQEINDAHPGLVEMEKNLREVNEVLAGLEG